LFRNYTIKAKLTGVALAGLVALSLIISILAINQSSKALVGEQFAKLHSIEIAKYGEIKNYFSYLEGLLVSLAGND
jgi:hypothetical protein